MKTTATYNYAFWNTMRGKHDRPSDMSEGGNSSGYVVPSEFNEKYLMQLRVEKNHTKEHDHRLGENDVGNV